MLGFFLFVCFGFFWHFLFWRKISALFFTFEFSLVFCFYLWCNLSCSAFKPCLFSWAPCCVFGLSWFRENVHGEPRSSWYQLDLKVFSGSATSPREVCVHVCICVYVRVRKGGLEKNLPEVLFSVLLSCEKSTKCPDRITFFSLGLWRAPFAMFHKLSFAAVTHKILVWVQIKHLWGGVGWCGMVIGGVKENKTLPQLEVHLCAHPAVCGATGWDGVVGLSPDYFSESEGKIKGIHEGHLYIL